jgi:hypothetical protein
MGSSALSVDDTFRDPFSIKVGKEINVLKVL